MLLIVEYLPTVAYVAAAGLAGYVGVEAGLAWWRRRKVSPAPVVAAAGSCRGLVGSPEPLRGISVRNVAANRNIAGNSESSAAAPVVAPLAGAEKDSPTPCESRAESDCACEQEPAVTKECAPEVDFGQYRELHLEPDVVAEAEVVLTEEVATPNFRGADTERCPSVLARFGESAVDELHSEGVVCNNAIPLRRDPSVRVFDTALDRVA